VRYNNRENKAHNLFGEKLKLRELGWVPDGEKPTMSFRTNYRSYKKDHCCMLNSDYGGNLCEPGSYGGWWWKSGSSGRW
jgi:hypothetical protein